MTKKEPYSSKSSSQNQLKQNEFDHFRLFLESACGISLGENKQYLVTNRIRHLLEENNLLTVTELVEEISAGGNRALRDSVIDAMTTNETLWFRDVYPFEQLKTTILPKLIAEKSRMFGPIRIWSAACSSGQEPYSISMIVEDYKRQLRGSLDRGVHIVATDLSSRILEQARLGEYDSLSVKRGLTADCLATYFDHPVENLWRVKNVVKDRVEFRSFNLMDSFSTLSKFDVVFCRNVLIYFNADLKQQILQKLHASLNPGGFLILGSAESLAGASHLFDMVRAGSGILYQAI